MNPAVSAHEWYLLACVAGTVLLLLFLVMRFRLHAAVGLAVVAFALGIASGMPLKQVPLSFSGGVGNMMGHIAIILAMGAILGQLLASWALEPRWARPWWRDLARKACPGRCSPWEFWWDCRCSSRWAWFS